MVAVLLPTRTLTGTIQSPVDNRPVQNARVDCHIPVPYLTDAFDNVIVADVYNQTAVTDSGGSFSIELLDPRNTNLSPNGFNWSISIRLPDGSKFASFSIPFPSGNAPFDLADVSPVQSDSGTPVYQGPQGVGVLVLAVGAPIPPGTPVGTVIFRVA